jgi:hypothetical protein
MSIKWEKKLVDRHLKGESPLGDVWIRLNRKGEVSGGYLLAGETLKWVPPAGWSGDLELAMLEMELIVDRRLLSKTGKLD